MDFHKLRELVAHLEDLTVSILEKHERAAIHFLFKFYIYSKIYR